MVSAMSDHLFLYNSYNFSNGSNLSFFDENAHVLRASLADKTASLTSSLFLLGKIPNEGLYLSYKNLIIEIISMKNLKIETLQITKLKIYNREKSS